MPIRITSTMNETLEDVIQSKNYTASMPYTSID